jgi:hypothetical protein
MSPRAARDAPIVIGQSPRADLLPPEIKLGERLRAQRRGLFALAALVLLVVIGASAGAAALAQISAASLATSTAETTSILAKQKKYADVNRANSGIKQAEASRLAATATEIDWNTQIAAILRSLPAGAVLTSVTATSSTPTVPLAASSSPLEGKRVAELNLTVKTTGIPDTAKWIGDLSGLTGFVDATPSTVASDGKAVTTSLVLHLNSSIYWHRFGKGTAK